MSAQLDTEFREFMHGRWPAMIRLAYALTGRARNWWTEGPSEHRRRA